MPHRLRDFSGSVRAISGRGGSPGFPGRPARPFQRREDSPMKTRLPVRDAILQRKTYEAPAEGRAGKIRLDFNENTAGCGPAVLRALAKLTPQQFAMYPEYQKSTARIAR